MKRLLFLLPAFAWSLGAAVDAGLPRYEPRPVEFPRASSYVTPAGAIAIVGYNDMQGIVEALDARFAATHPGFTFALTLKGTRTAPPALARGESAFAPMGAEFAAAELAAYRAAIGGEPRLFRIAHCSLSAKALSGPLAIIVNRDCPLDSLTLEQVRRIFGGGIAQWGDLGLAGVWAGISVHPRGLRAELALGIFFRERLALGETFGAEFRGFAQSAEVVQCVADDPLAIGFTAVNRVTPGVKVLALAADERTAPVALTEESIRAGRYPLDRFLLVYVRQPLDPFVREYLRLVLSRDGQAIIAGDTLGYLPLNSAEAAIERAKL
jgi:phosphate transport system substrate-binding protein